MKRLRNNIFATAAVAVACILGTTLANAQEEDGKVSFSVQGDLVSSYIWRGFYQTGANFQPTLSLWVAIHVK